MKFSQRQHSLREQTMSPSTIDHLTPEQAAFIPLLRQQWIDRSTQPLDQNQAKAAIGALYESIGKNLPQFIFVASPAVACLLVALLRDSDRASGWNSLGGSLRDVLEHQGLDLLATKLEASLSLGVEDALKAQLTNLIWQQLDALLGRSLLTSLGDTLGNLLHAQSPSAYAALFEFGNFIGVAMNPAHYELYMNYCKHVSWIFPFEHTVIACDRPRTIHWDADGKLHGAGKPAIQFADGSGVWAYHGVRLPERYRRPPEQWQAQWLLKESNPELRQLLIQGMGYERIVQELGAEIAEHYRELDQ